MNTHLLNSKPGCLLVLLLGGVLSGGEVHGQSPRMIPVDSYDRFGNPYDALPAHGPAPNRPERPLPTEDTFDPPGQPDPWRRPSVPVNPFPSSNTSADSLLDSVNAAISAIEQIGQRGGGGNQGSRGRRPQGPGPGGNTQPPPSDRDVLFQVLQGLQNSQSPAYQNATRGTSPPRPVQGLRLGVYGQLLPGGGFRLLQVPRGSLAQRLGFEPGDEIHAVNGRTVTSTGQIIRAINAPSRRVTFLVRNVRDGKLLNVTCTF